MNTKPKFYDILHSLDWRRRAIFDGEMENRDLTECEMVQWENAIKLGFTAFHLLIEFEKPIGHIIVNDMRSVK